MRYLSKKRLAVLTVAITASIASVGFAAEEQLDEFAGEEYVVTATKTKLEAKEVPQAVEVITQEKIKDLGAQNVRDALRTSMGLNLSKAGMTGNAVMLRGMDTAHTLILIDGKRTAGEDSRETLNVYDLNRIDMSDVERIEIIRGNSSALYGSDALGGVINIITKKADKEAFSIGIDTGTEEVNEYLRYSTGKIGKLSAKFGARFSKEREVYHDTSAYASSSNMYGNKRYFDLGINYAFDDQRGLDFDFKYARERLDQNASRNISAANLNFNSVNGYENDRMDYSLNFYGKTKRHDFNVRTYYSYYKKSSDGSALTVMDVETPLVHVVSNGLAKTDDNHSFSNWTTEAKDSYKADEHNTLTYGMEYKHATSDRNFSVTTSSTGYREMKRMGRTFPMNEPESTVNSGGYHSSNSFAAYVQDEYKPNDKLLVIPSLRYDYQNGFGSNLSAKLGTTYNLSKASRVKFNVGQGYRTPTLFELYGDMVKNMMGYEVHVRGDENLDPEKSLNIDLGVEGELGKSTGRLTYFHNKVDNLIDSKDDPTKLALIDDDHFYQVYYNVGEATIQGIEAEATYNFDKHFSAKATYTYLDAMNDVTNSRLDNRARHNGTVQLQYTDATKNPLTLTLWDSYNVGYHYSDTDYTYSTLNFVANKQINKNFRMYAGVDNIFNKTFESQKTYLLDGRTWRVGAEWKF